MVPALWYSPSSGSLPWRARSPGCKLGAEPYDQERGGHCALVTWELAPYHTSTQGLLDSRAEMASPCHMGQEEVSFSVLSVAAEEALRLGEVETCYLEVSWAGRDRHAHCPL